MRGMIAAVSANGVIGLHGEIPWHHSADLKRFKRITMGATVIMGRRTWESIGAKPLPGRRNIVITSRDLPGVECFRTIPEALAACEGDVWFVGGAEIYREAMDYCDVLDITRVPVRVDDPDAIRFPEIDRTVWEPSEPRLLEDDPLLANVVYTRKTPRKD